MTTHEIEAEPLTAHDRGEAAVAVLLESLGFDVEGERLRDTPRRVATTLAALVHREPLPPLTLFEADRYEGPIVLRDIPFASLCEHHLFPFRGVVHVGYLPVERVVGISTLVRVVDWVARDLQMQERMTADIAEWLQHELEPKGVGVRIEAEHLCMSMRGVGTPDVRATTSIFRGAFTAADLEGTR